MVVARSVFSAEVIMNVFFFFHTLLIYSYEAIGTEVARHPQETGSALFFFSSGGIPGKKVNFHYA